MATLQKFKLLATQCAVAGSPTRSPTTSPVIHLRRRKTLRMLLGRTAGGERRFPHSDDSPDPPSATDSPEKKNRDLGVSHKLKDLFVSSSLSPPPLEERATEKGRDVGEGVLRADGGGSAAARRGGPRSLRPLSATFRQRLLRRAWRPVLVAIPE
ncbi:hypothetical protein CEY00_Acc03992 [Actinidia chinensis var. chinensis]|uniref:Uncharacterized protein n=1 Tax=Actinidia chinensis var. chinensis TaxID=1590841 RepID=A0A2R6RUB1_ACTCC|nr:hypothetical protein CEY00_Acc03992 [Actinidia chinensis var. chinensis]